jgi:hypothetical protein
MEIGMRPVEAAPDEERITAEVRVRTVAVVAAERAAHHMRLEERRMAERGLQEEDGEDVEYDFFAVEASQFRETWNQRYSSYYGCFEDTSKLFFALPNPWSLSLICNWQLDPLLLWLAGSLFYPGVVFSYPSTIEDNHTIINFVLLA